MSRIDFARKVRKFLAIYRMDPKKRTKAQREMLAILDVDLGDSVDQIFKSVNLKPDPLFAEEPAEAEASE